jgi:hypothetical protein
MSIFGNIASAIFGTSKGGPPPVGLAAASSSVAASTTSGQSAASAATGKPMSRDELAMIEKIAGGQDENYSGTVDCRFDEAIEIDSSFTARKQLAQERLQGRLMAPPI